MELNRRSALAGVAAFGAAPKAFAQAFPSKPIKIVVPLAASSTTDLAARGRAMTQGRMEISPLGLDDFAAYVKAEAEWWTKSIKADGIEPQ